MKANYFIIEIVYLFSASDKCNERAKAKLESRQIVAKEKRMAAEQAEFEALDAENDVEAIEFEIEVITRKGCIEETFWRFPHIGQQIFEELENISMAKCLEINKWWQKFINEQKILQINLLEKHTNIKSSTLKKALSNTDFETVQKLSNYYMKVYKKVTIDMNNDVIAYRKQQEKIHCYLFKKKHRDKTQHLLTELMFKHTMNMTPDRGLEDFLGKVEPLIQNEDFELLQLMQEHLDTTSKRRNVLWMILDLSPFFAKKWRNVNFFSEGDGNILYEKYFNTHQ